MIAEAEGLPLEETFKGKTVAVSGSGNVAQYAALKVSSRLPPRFFAVNLDTELNRLRERRQSNLAPRSSVSPTPGASCSRNPTRVSPPKTS
jgi:hypothetical protein